MTIIIFLLVLALLIFVHELGHFIAAKWSGVRVDEFAIGFPPEIYSWKRGETKYAINLIPFGGYVKIFGEKPEDGDENLPDASRSFVNALKYKQALILVAGVFFNFLLAWLFFTISFLAGVPATTDQSLDKYVGEQKVMILSVEDKSPAKLSGLETGDLILAMKSGTKTMATTTVDNVVAFVRDSQSPIVITYSRANKILMATATPVTTVSGANKQKALGISLTEAAILQLPIHLAVWQGLVTTYNTTVLTVVSLARLIGSAFVGQADFSQISGPIGIVNMVGAAKAIGISYLLGFIAMISVNLAVINLIPFPALDGGRLLFVLIEAIIRRPIKVKVANILNAVGFALLIALMIYISIKDVIKFF